MKYLASEPTSGAKEVSTQDPSSIAMKLGVCSLFRAGIFTTLGAHSSDRNLDCLRPQELQRAAERLSKEETTQAPQEGGILERSGPPSPPSPPAPRRLQGSQLRWLSGCPVFQARLGRGTHIIFL